MKHTNVLFWVVLSLSLGSNSLAETGGEFLPSGVSTEAIQLPKSPGSIEGIEKESASVSNTGTLKYSIQIQVPKGRNGLQPNIALAYDSSNGQGVFGFGWRMDISSIDRSNLRGVPLYQASDLISTSQDGELVAFGSGAYRPLINSSQSWYRYLDSSDSWTHLKGDGSINVFGGRNDAKIATTKGTYKWLLSASSDSFGNRIEYFYIHDSGQVYLSEIRYVFSDSSLTSNLYSIAFEYEARSDILSNYQSSDLVKTQLRCTDIRVSSGSLIRHYHLSYDLTPNGKLSRLRTVQLFGTDDTTAYPALSFSYSQERSIAGLKTAVTGFSGNRPPSMSNAQTTFADLNGDSIPDIIATSEHGAKFWKGEGNGVYANPVAVPNLLGELGSKNTRLMDIDGDRFVDFVGSGQYPKYLSGNGNGGFGPPIDIVNFPRYSLGTTQVRTFDVNGDGRMDLIAQEPGAIFTFFNGGEGNWDRYVKVTPSDGEPFPMFSFSSPKTFFVDMNGDGLTDIAFVQNDKIYYYPNRGDGHWAPIQALSFEDSTILNAAQYTKNIFLTDINGDGLPDLLVVYENDFFYAYAQGDGTYGQTQSVAGVHATSFDSHGMAITSADVPANGSISLVWTNDSGDYRYFDFVGDIKPNLLSEIKNGMGKKVEVNYLPHTRYGATELLPEGAGRIPFVAQTVREIKTYNWSQLASDSLYQYFGGTYLGKKNEFRGFALIEKINVGDETMPSQLDRRFYETGELASLDKARGLEKASELRSIQLSKKKVRTEGAILQARNQVLSQIDLSDNGSGQTSGVGFASNQEIIEGDSTGATRSYQVATGYTVNQDAISSKLITTKNLAGVVYRKVQDDFAYGGHYSGGLPDRWLVTSLQERAVKDASSNVKLSTRLFYDGSNTLGTVTQGKITAKKAFDGSNYITKSTYAWDSFGNLHTFTDAASHTSTIAYDSGFHLFPVSLTNPKSQVETAEYDVDLGVMTKSTNVNSFSQYYVYDELLRLKNSTGPLASGTSPDPAHPTVSYDYIFGDDLGNPSSIKTTSLTDIGETTTISSKQYFDGLGRTIATLKQGKLHEFVHDGGVRYNLLGKVTKQFMPFFVENLDSYALNASRPARKTTFDVLGRPLEVENPESTSLIPSLKQFAYKVGEVNFTDENAHTGKQFYDFLGRLSESKNALKRSTFYTYSVTDQIAKIVDAKGSETLFEYDTLDRRVCKLDPNLGKTTYEYNDLDLLTQKSEFGFESGIVSCSAINTNAPKITSISYGDSLNRITNVSFSGTSPFTPGVSYVYDSSTNGVGKLANVAFGTGQKAFNYDAYGNIEQTDYFVNGSFFSVKEKRDVLGRLRKVEYPVTSSDPFKVGYEYDDASSLARVFNVDSNASFASGFTYNEVGQLLSFQYGNGVRLRQTYDSKSYRLNEIFTYKGTPVGTGTPISSACTGSDIVQCLEYQYDPVSNLTQITDYITELSNPITTTRSFSYDSIDQLESATGPWGSQDFTYDEIGNITSKNSTTLKKYTSIRWIDQLAAKVKSKTPGLKGLANYSYESERPQILTSAGTENFGFDRFGNLSTRASSDSFTFNAKNELVTSSTASGLSTYRYDESGNRIFKSSSSGNSFFVGKYFEKRGPNTYKYIYAGNRRLASLSSGSSALQYYHPDHLGSVNYVTDATGTVTLHREHAPFGEVADVSGIIADVNVGFTDKYYDDETGLNYFGARYYLPGVGKWTSADPKFIAESILSGKTPSERNRQLSDGQRLQLWTYVLNRPLSSLDKTGRFGEATALGTAFFGPLGTVVGAAIDTVAFVGSAAVAAYAANKAVQVYNEQHADQPKPATPVADTFAPGGEKVGVQGKAPDVRVGKVTEDQMWEKFGKAAEGGKILDKPDYDGIMVETPEGGTVGLRESKKHGLTIDVDVSTIEGGSWRLHKPTKEEGVPNMFIPSTPTDAHLPDSSDSDTAGDESQSSD